MILEKVSEQLRIPRATRHDNIDIYYRSATEYIPNYGHRTLNNTTAFPQIRQNSRSLSAKLHIAQFP